MIEKANVLGKMILAMRGIYSNASSSQKQLMETVVGAAIFYFPRNQNLWTGKLSKKALDHLSKEGTTKGLTQEHQYPRKEAGRELLAGISRGSDDITAEICDLYLNRYGCYNWVTSKENKQLVDFQKQGVFSTPETAYKNAGITLMELTKDQFRELKKGKRSVMIK